jgi:uncharacterized protein (DUF1684 family)
MKIIIYFILILTVVILTYTFFNMDTDRGSFIDEIKAHREEIDQFMRSDPNSPFLRKGGVEYRGLNYYDINKSYKIQASVTVNTHPESITLKMSDGSKTEYLKYARIEFSLREQPQVLTLLKQSESKEDPLVFLPFYDKTSAFETYGGGRYLDMEYHNEKTITIDFNKAYNPYCAYTDSYRCPLPPRENEITVPVEAGEKIYEQHD